MGKRGKSQRKPSENPGKKKKLYEPLDDDMDDEVDAFIKQRDIVPLDIDDDVRESDDEDNEQPVFNFENINDDDEEDDYDIQDKGMTGKIISQQRYLKGQFGGADEMHDDEDNEVTQKPVYGGRGNLYGADNRGFELQSSDDDSAKEEEAEVLKLQDKRTEELTLEDFGQVESNRELTLEEIPVLGNSEKKSFVRIEVTDDMGTAYEEVKKDLNALSKEEQMNVLNNSAPELVGLLSELNDALEELENKVDPILSKVKRGEVMMEGGMRYLEVKQLLLLTYSQAITFYLLLKSEGQQVRDHPVLARLVEIKSLLDKMKQLDENLPSNLEEIINKYAGVDAVVKLVNKDAAKKSDPIAKGYRPQLVSHESEEVAVSHSTAELEKVEYLKDNENEMGKRKRQNDEIGIQSMKMLKARAALEEKLKQKGMALPSISPKTDKPRKLVKLLNGKLESYDDFDDDPINVEGAVRARASKVSKLVSANRKKMSKLVSGDDDLPQRDDIGERRKKYELRVLAGAGIKSEDDARDENDTNSDDDVEMEDSGSGDSDDDLYKLVKQNRDAKLAGKAEIHSRSSVPYLRETVDGKRNITYQMEKNRGLTRARNKDKKNPRKNYKLKHKKQVVKRKGQVRDVIKPTGPYSGEASGINAGVSKSNRFKH